MFANSDEEDDEDGDEDGDESDSVPQTTIIPETSPTKSHMQVMFIQMEFCEKSTLR